MNKKIIALIVTAVIILIAVGTFVFINRDRGTTDVNNNNNNVNENNNNNNVDNENENENNNEEEEENMNGEERILVLYFSQSGNTEAVARNIQATVGGDLVELETVQDYPSSYNELLDFAQNEQRTNARPELKTTINIDDYDTIFLGYPNWWADMPMPIYSFLDDYDLTGKKIAPFMTHGGSGLSGTPAKIKSAEAGATVLDALAVSSGSAKNAQSTVDSWLERIGY